MDCSPHRRNYRSRFARMIGFSPQTAPIDRPTVMGAFMHDSTVQLRKRILIARGGFVD